MRKLCLGALGVLSVTFLVASISLLLAHVFQKVLDLQVRKETILRNGTDIFKAWENPPPPVHMQYYFFNLTNPLEVLQGESPIVTEVGPYTYREYRPRVDVHLLDNGTKVSSLSPRTYFFVREMSVGDPEVDLIRTVNVPAVAVMDMITTTSLHLPVEVLLLIYQEELFVMHSVHELLWGYTDKLLSFIHKFHRSIDPEFGYFRKDNGTDDGEYIILSGEKNYLDFTKIVEWKGKSSLDWWTSAASNMINGTDGSTFHPLIDKDETIYVFASDFCRSLYLTFDSYLTLEGISAYRFVPPLKVFANASMNPDNAGFCVPAGNCLGAGLLNVSVCREGAPIFLSPPHFYQSDEKYVKAIDGMHPNKKDHETFLDINPLTGIVMQAAKRMQINVYLKQLPDFFQTGKVRTMFYPVMYINESFLLDKESADQLRVALLEGSVLTNTPFVILALGVIFGVIFVVLVCKPLRAREEGTEGLIDPE